MAVHWRLSGDYYVDGIGGDDANAGTSVAPFKSIGAAASAASAGETIIVGTGVYNESIDGGNKAKSIIKADGNVIMDGSGLTQAVFYNMKSYYIYDFTVINVGDYCVENGVDYRNKNAYTRCTFKDCTWFWIGNNFYSTTYVPTHQDCKYINFSGSVAYISNLKYIQYINFSGCFFFNAPLFCTRAAAYNTNYNLSNMTNCWFDQDETTGEWEAVYFRGYYTAMTMNNCFFGPGATILSNTLWSIGDPKTPAEAKASGSGLCLAGNPGYLQTTASYNMNLSGSGAIEGTYTTLQAGNNNTIYSSQLQPAFSFLSTQAPTTAYGWSGSTGNILHTDGGATWTNITSSGDSLQISSSAHPTGSIVSAIVDLGSPKVVNSIKSSWTTTTANACAPAVYSSSVLNQNPTRYTYEMSYGNSNPPDSGYQVFEFDEQPYVSTNGSGSGDMGFLTSSYNDLTARYLQFRITLRTNLTGSV